MKFHLVDKIEAIEPGKRIVTTKLLSLAEEYLADHFPTFPVMPGVLMLEALTQAGAWLIRVQQNFAKSLIVLASARNVRYMNFVQPGQMLRCELDAMSIDDTGGKFKASGFVGETPTVSARLELRSFNLAERGMSGTADEEIVADLKKRFELIGGPVALAAAAGGQG